MTKSKDKREKEEFDKGKYAAKKIARELGYPCRVIEDIDAAETPWEVEYALTKERKRRIKMEYGV